MKKKQSNLVTVLLVLILLAGVALLAYPSVADYWNSFTQSQVINSYTNQLQNLDNEKYAEIISAARDYNERLRYRTNHYILTPEQKEEYEQLLNISGVGAMGYIEIPSINCSIPVYHGTSDAVLQIAVGHLDWTSLPVGGAGTHCVLSGHRGLPSAKLFTDLDKVAIGDLFMLRILNETLTYEVDQILIVNPDQTQSLLIEEDKDLCTLVTCTPYGINTHRLLVRGHRVENVNTRQVRVTADAMQIEPLLIAPIVATPVLLVLLIVLLLPKRPKLRPEDDDDDDEM